MLKKLSVILFLALFLVSSIAVAKNLVENSNASKRANVSSEAKLFMDDKDVPTMYAPAPKFGVYSTAQTFAPSRQVLNSYTTQRDMWHNTANGRQIAYSGYFNSACDYVLMDWPTAVTAGSSTLLHVDGAFFDWTTGIWNLDVGSGGLVQVGTEPSYYAQMAVDPKSGNGVAAYHSFADGTNGYSMAGFANCSDFGAWASSQMPGPPNLEHVNTGFCGDVNTSLTPYIWPHHDVDTNAAGQVVVHVATQESGDCTTLDGDIETSSFLYYRKVGSAAWEGPHFIDSGYLISQLVVADRNGPNVYYCYPKPVYYQQGPNPHPCDNGAAPGYYQHTQDIAYRMSTNDGATWGPVVKVTDYAEGFEQGLTDPSRYDLTAMVDPDGNLHMVWWSNDWFKDPQDATICGANSGFYYVGKLWHYDTGNDCISVAYDASHPALFTATPGTDAFGTFRTVCTKPNISWCDDKLYIAFERYGAHPVGDTSSEVDAPLFSGDTVRQIADIMVVGSDATGNMGQTWTDAVNLTDTESDSCLPGDCFSEVWPTMSMFSTDSLMINYLEDKDPGQAYSRAEGVLTDNPVMFLTWPCFSMADVGNNPCLSANPSNTAYAEIALAPNGNPAGCTTPATYSDNLVLSNCGNVGLTYTTSSGAGWLSVTGGASGSVSAGAGPSNSDAPGWSGASGCASPATINWQASSASLGTGNYTGTITVDVSDPTLDDITIEVNLVVACDYYLPEYATISGGCWNIDLFNTPQAGNGSDNNNLGNMKFYSCGDTIAPLYNEAMIIGWKVGSDTYCYTDNSDNHMGAQLPASLPSYQRQNARMRALGPVVVDSVGTPGSGSGYTFTTGYWCTPDSVVYGKTEYIVPGHQDTSVLIEKISVWNESGAALNNFLVGEGIDWDVRRDSNKDAGGFDIPRKMVFQYGSGPDANIYAGLSPYNGEDDNYGAAVLDNPEWIYPDTGYNIIDIYDYLTTLDGSYNIFSDSLTDLNSVFRFYEGTLAANAADTLVFCKVKTVSLDGLSGLQALIDKGKAFIDNYELCGPVGGGECQGRCGDANADGSVNVSDAVYVINYVFITGSPEPLPVKACGDANSDASVNVSDAVYIINYVFIVGSPSPSDCAAGSWPGGDCCSF